MSRAGVGRSFSIVIILVDIYGPATLYQLLVHNIQKIHNILHGNRKLCATNSNNGYMAEDKFLLSSYTMHNCLNCPELTGSNSENHCEHPTHFLGVSEF